ncbi:MAG: hypothetical protein AVDCRST_MAG86-2362, partial [uncultured Truepera sp.]
ALRERSNYEKWRDEGAQSSTRQRHHL